MKKATKREKRLRRKKRKQALERLILKTEAKLEGRSEKPEEWTWEAGKERTITLPPPKPGRTLTIKAAPGTPLSVEVPGMGRIGPLVSGSEPMTEEQFHKMLQSLLG